MSGRVVTNQHGLRLHVGGRRRPTQTRETHPEKYRALVKYGTLPSSPTTFDYTAVAPVALAMILANGPDPTAPAGVPATGVGDCTSAGPGHAIDSATANAGTPVVVTSADAIAFYCKSCNYVIGNESTDQGGDEVTVCSVWRDQGYFADGSHKIAGWGALTDTEVADAAFVRNCAWLFPLMFGVELADAWLQVSGDGFVWDVGPGISPNPSNGHCFMALGANAQGLIIDSWGLIGTITWAAIAQFCVSTAGGNLFAILTQDLINRATQKAPEGFDWPTLVSDLDADVAGNAPATAPTPPPPVVVPTGPATLENIQAWVAAGIQSGDPLQSQADAIANANAGLAKYWPSGS